MRENNTKALVQSAIFVALGIVISYLITYLPIGFMIPFLVLPLLPLILSERYGSKYGILMSVSMCMLILLLDPIQLAFDVPCLVIGTTLGIGVSKGMKPLNNLGMTWLASSVTMVGLMWVLGQLMGFNPLENMIEQFNVANDMMLDMGLTTMPNFDMMIEMMTRSFIGILVVSQLFVCIWVILVGRFLLKRLRIDTLNEYYLTDFEITRDGFIGIIAVVMMLYLLRVVGIVLIDPIMYNLAFIIMTLFTFNGLCAINAIMRSYNVAKPMRLMVLLFSFMLLAQWLVIFSIIDSIFGVRRKVSNRTERIK